MLRRPRGTLYAKQALDGVQALLAGAQNEFTTEYPCNGLDRDRWFVMHAIRSDPKSNVIILSHTDISSQKRAEQALKDSEQRFRALAQMSPDAILVSVEGRYVYANEAAVQLLGAANDQAIIGCTPYDIVEPPFHALVRERIRLAIEESRVVPLLEYRWRRFDGASLDVEVATGPITWLGKRAVQAVARDISDRKRAEAALPTWIAVRMSF